MNEYRNLVESLTTMIMTHRLRYPKQINLSEEFRAALKKEVSRHQQMFGESNEPLNNFEDKLLKALKFEIFEHCGHCHSGEKDAKKIRKMRKQSPTKR
jgi:hypothetical protein